MPRSLDEIAQSCGTDKSAALNALTEKYEMYLAPRRAEPLTLLEIGIYQGGSLRMWHEYFPHATIVGADILEAPADLSALAPRVRTCRVDQSDPEQLRRLAEPLAAAGGIDIIIDDGSHFCSHQITTFKALYPFLGQGGIFFVEDVTTNYNPHYGGGLGRPDTFLRFAQDLVPFIPMSMGYVPPSHPWEEDIDFVHFSGYGGLVAIGKLSAARKAKILGHAG